MYKLYQVKMAQINPPFPQIICLYHQSRKQLSLCILILKMPVIVHFLPTCDWRYRSWIVIANIAIAGVNERVGAWLTFAVIQSDKSMTAG